jgi:NhaP-type Na+/H+ and K+/H+ antiporter
LVNELNLDPRTHVKVKNLDVEVIKGELSEKPWLIESEGKNYVLLEEEQYDDLIRLLKEVLEQNLDLKMEQRILNEMPIDLEDVKTVVKKEIEDENLSIEEAINKVKTEYPNLFHKIEFENFLKELF